MLNRCGFWGKKGHFYGEIFTFWYEWSPLRALSACGQILHKNPGKGQTPPPIQAMPVFWELLDRQPIPKEEKVIFYESLNVQKQARWSLLYISAGLWRMRGGLLKQSGARPPHPSLALLQVTEPQIWGLYHCGQNRGEELSKIRYICGLNLLVRDGQWSRSTMINNIRSYP